MGRNIKIQATKRTSFSKNVSRLRKLYGLNQLELAEAVGVSGTSIKNIETGKTKGRSATQEKIAKVLRTTLAELHSDPEQPQKFSHFDFGNAADFLHAFSQLSPVHQKVVLALVYRDMRVLTDAPISLPSEIPPLLAPVLKALV